MTLISCGEDFKNKIVDFGMWCRFTRNRETVELLHISGRSESQLSMMCLLLSGRRSRKMHCVHIAKTMMAAAQRFGKRKYLMQVCSQESVPRKGRTILKIHNEWYEDTWTKKLNESYFKARNELDDRPVLGAPAEGNTKGRRRRERPNVKTQSKTAYIGSRKGSVNGKRFVLFQARS